MKNKTIIILIKIIHNCIVKMLNGNSDIIAKYNNAYWILDDMIEGSIRRGENPHTLEIDKLNTIECEIFHISLKCIIKKIEAEKYYL